MGYAISNILECRSALDGAWGSLRGYVAEEILRGIYCGWGSLRLLGRQARLTGHT